jgi:PKD repeat protein
VVAVVAMVGLMPAGVAQANVTVSFATRVSDMTVSVDVTAYTGVDVQFCWYFGDEPDGGDFGSAILCRGASAFGRSATHTYTTPGTYTISVVADDALGIGGGASQQVTVPGTATFQPPTASFTTAVSGLTVVVDGSGSRDVDGAVVRWCYDFGAGAPPTCQGTPRASYTYGASGTYVVLLTVTDDTGVTGSVSKSVTVAAPARCPPAGVPRTPAVRGRWLGRRPGTPCPAASACSGSPRPAPR